MITNELAHHGVKGMKWGVRRYRNSDGSLTPAGRKRYSSKSEQEEPSRAKKVAKVAALRKLLTSILYECIYDTVFF